MLLIQQSSYSEISREFSSCFLILTTLVLIILLMFTVIIYMTRTISSELIRLAHNCLLLLNGKSINYRGYWSYRSTS